VPLAVEKLSSKNSTVDPYRYGSRPPSWILKIALQDPSFPIVDNIVGDPSVPTIKLHYKEN